MKNTKNTQNTKAKTKKNVIIAGTSLVCAALICVTVSRFAAEQPIQTDRTYAETEPAEIVTTVVTTLTPDKKEPEITMTIKSDKAAETEVPAETKPMTEVDRSFEEITKPVTEPPAPAVKDEAALTDPAAPPEYEPQQTTVTAAPEPKAIHNGMAKQKTEKSTSMASAGSKTRAVKSTERLPRICTRTAIR